MLCFFRNPRNIVYVLFSILLTSCVTPSGHYFVKDKHQSKSNASVYLFRDDEVGTVRYPTILINNKPSGDLVNKGFTKYILSPGKYSFDIDWDFNHHLDIELKAGKTYYIRPWLTHTSYIIPFIKSNDTKKC